VKARVIAFVRERAAIGAPGATPGLIEGGASFAYVFGTVLVFLLAFEAATGTALAAFYSPSANNAWGSVAYIQDQATWGWVIRGLHHHGGGAIVVVAGLHLVQTAMAGAYKRPRELVWWLGLLLLVLCLAWAVTGFVLPWDQAGFWANKVELGIAAGTPVIGAKIKALALGGNDYGNLTLTRFYALHIIVLPVVVTLVTIAHVVLARRHGTTAVRSRAGVPRWPDQAVRDSLAVALTFSILLAWVVSQHGVELAAPANPSQAYDARPLWYFRWLFELRVLAGSAEKIAAMVAPAIVGGFLVMLPFLDRGPARAPRTRMRWLGVFAGMLALICGLTVMSFSRDGGDDDLAKRQTAAAKVADRARLLARTNGIPATGAIDVFSTAPMWRARTIYAQRCAGCHEDPKDRKGPLIAPGHGNRAWIKGLLEDPSGDLYWGRSKLVKQSLEAQKLDQAKPEPAPPPPPPTKKSGKQPPAAPTPAPPEPAKSDDGPKDLAMKPAPFKGAELDDLVELLYAQTGATDVDPAKAKRGSALFESACTDCHSIGEGVAGTSAPGLAGLGSRDHYTSFISNPKAPIHMGEDMSQMPRFDHELSIVDRDALAAYLVWLRTATKAELDALGPL
jgi:ubiquinol-cytochrome c reductase cytochrome b subunit